MTPSWVGDMDMILIKPDEVVVGRRTCEGCWWYISRMVH